MMRSLAFVLAVALRLDRRVRGFAALDASLRCALTGLLAVSAAAHAGTLQTLSQQPPVVVGLPFLLTDGSVMVQGDSNSDWWQLVPDANGSYLNGSWKQLASIPYNWNYAPFAYASAVLADGRVLIEGGEYNENGPFSITNKGAIYDPLRDTWARVEPPPDWGTIGDSPSIVMPNGKFLLGDKVTQRIAELDPATLTWTALGTAGKSDLNAEEGWTLLPDGTIFTVDVTTPPNTERYTYVDAPGAGTWSSAGNTPVSLSFNYGIDPIAYPGGSYLPPGETGPCILRPDQTVFCTGASDDTATNIAHTAIYTVATARWTRGPDFPAGDDAGDTSAVLMPNGNVLMSAESGNLYEFDGSNLVRVGNVGPGASLIVLPSGEVLVSAAVLQNINTPNEQLVPDVQIYTPANAAPEAAWAPTIASAPPTLTPGASYPISGTQFNGLSQAQAYGDELVAPTNYPLVRITNNASHTVRYARTHDHSSMGVATGTAVVSTTFDVPGDIEAGSSSLVVIANGIASLPVSVNVVSATLPFTIGPAINGSWFDNQQSGHGFQIEVLPGDPLQMSVFWFVFAPHGGAAWIAASGPVSGDHATLQAYQVIGAGGLFPPHFDPANVHAQPWGTITLAFSACNTGQVSWNSTLPDYGVGSLPLTRLTLPAGLRCP